MRLASSCTISKVIVWLREELVVWQADLTEDSMPILDGVALVLNNRREISKITVEGHTCNAPSWVRSSGFTIFILPTNWFVCI